MPDSILQGRKKQKYLILITKKNATEKHFVFILKLYEYCS